MSVGGVSDPEQEKWFDDAQQSVKKQAFFMKRALDGQQLREALKCASTMISELRTSKLSPRNYYELYMNVTDELRELEAFFEDEDLKDQKGAGGRSIVELYETVQHAGNIIPRLYLLITVGAVYIKSKRAAAKDILFDLVELCRGVQHPMRGLFLRTYLSQMAKDKLPDVGNEYIGGGGAVKDSIEFILQNFKECNTLWVRMQHQGAVRDKAKREKERNNLRQLVGSALVRLSEMNGVDLGTYTELVLPKVLEQIVNCKDGIAQEYLMECVIQVFPADFHLHTLEKFLATCGQLQENVNVKNILILMMNRLARYAKETKETNASMPATIDMFTLFHKYSSQIIKANPKMVLADILSLQVALINFSTSVYPENIEYVDSVLKFCDEVMSKLVGTGKVTESASIKNVVELLTLPLEALQLHILSLQNYAPILNYLELLDRKRVAVTITSSVVKARTPLDTADKVDKLFVFIAPLIKDENTNTENNTNDEKKVLSDEEKFEFDQEQHLVARLFQLIGSPDTDVHFQLYSTARKHFGQGGTLRIEFTLPPMVFGSLQLALRVWAREEAKDATVTVKTKKIFGFVHETITVLTSGYADIALRLFLHAAQTADKCNFEAIAYEFTAQAFIAYEDEVADSKAQYAAINLIVATLHSMHSFSNENYDTLVSKATQHCAKLLKKVDQCRAVYNCAHLFWFHFDEKDRYKIAANEKDKVRLERALSHRDDKRVLACLQRSLKIANACMGQQVHLFVEILNKYLYFFDRQCPSITVKYLKGLVTLIEEHIRTLDNSESSKLAKQHYANTLAHIKLKQAGDDESAARYREFESGGKEEATSIE